MRRSGNRSARNQAAGMSHDPEKHVPDAIGDGYRFSDKIMRKQIGV